MSNAHFGYTSAYKCSFASRTPNSSQTLWIASAFSEQIHYTITHHLCMRLVLFLKYLTLGVLNFLLNVSTYVLSVETGCFYWCPFYHCCFFSLFCLFQLCVYFHIFKTLSVSCMKMTDTSKIHILIQKLARLNSQGISLRTGMAEERVS